MKKKSIFSFSLMFMLMTVSCSHDNDLYPPPPFDEIKDGSVEYYTLHVIYEDKDYYSLCKIDGDSTFVLDEELKAFLAEMESRNFSIVAHNDSTIEYCKEKEDVMPSSEISEIMTKAGPVQGDIACLDLWDDTNFRDTHREFHIKSNSELFDIPVLKDYGLNDKVSSLKIQNTMSISTATTNLIAIVTVWEDSDFNYGDHDRTKHRMNFYAAPGQIGSYENLKKIPCGSSSSSWNDRISSLSFHIGYKYSMPTTY